MIKKSRSDSHKSAPSGKTSLLTEAELALINTELGASLRKSAEHFITEVKKRFDPLSKRADAQSMTEAADKIARIRRELSLTGDASSVYSDTRVRNLFYAPSLFAKGDWHNLSHEERIRIISTGLKITGTVIEQRYKADTSSEYRAYLSRTTKGEATPARKKKKAAAEDSTPVPPLPAQLEPEQSSADRASVGTGAVIEEHLPLPPSPVLSMEPQPVAHARTPQPPFDQRVLLTPITRVPWKEQRISNALEKETTVHTLLDLANLPARRLTTLMNAAKSNPSKFRHAMKDMCDSNGNACGEALALIFSPLSALPLSAMTIEKLEKVKVYPSVWCGNGFGSDSHLPPVGIDNGWRLLRHYDPSTMAILSAEELHAIRKIFQDAGFFGKR